MTKEEAIKVASEIHSWLKTDREREALEALIPELRESEDERIRKELVEKITNLACGCFISQEQKQRFIHYLEKQKEHEEGDRTYEAKIYWKGRSDAMKQKEQNPINESNMHEPTLDEARKWNEAYEKGYSLGYENGRNEHKPAWSEEDRLHYANVLEALEYVKGCKSDYDKIEAIKSDIAWFKSRRPQPKQEWSEEDKTMLNNLIWAVHMKSISPLDEMDDRGKYERYEKFLTSLPERFGLKPEREWSEEDDQLIGFIFDLLNDLVWRKDWAMSKEECLERLKSLRLLGPNE